MLDSERYRRHAELCLKAATNASSDVWSRRMHLSMCGAWLTLAIEDERMNAIIARWGLGQSTEATLVPD